MREVLLAARANLDACLPETGSVSIRLTVSELGRVTFATATGDASRETRECVMAAFRGVVVDERASVPRTVSVSLSRARVDAALAEADDAAGPETGAPVPDADADAEAALRARIDARRGPILACVGQTSVALGVSFAVDGSVQVALRGALAGTDEERCVRAALGTLWMDPAPIGAGALIHAVSSD